MNSNYQVNFIANYSTNIHATIILAIFLENIHIRRVFLGTAKMKMVTCVCLFYSFLCQKVRKYFLSIFRQMFERNGDSGYFVHY